jgi:hypothetical protein
VDGRRCDRSEAELLRRGKPTGLGKPRRYFANPSPRGFGDADVDQVGCGNRLRPRLVCNERRGNCTGDPSPSPSFDFPGRVPRRRPSQSDRQTARAGADRSDVSLASGPVRPKSKQRSRRNPRAAEQGFRRRISAFLGLSGPAACHTKAKEFPTLLLAVGRAMLRIL